MCGIFFSIGFENLPASVIDSVAHRGPDGRGWNEFISPQGPVIIAHRRLAVVDVSEEGHQPMSIIDGRYWITYNGEIYNYLEIRKELENQGYKFKTKTDTEVLLKSYLRWGEKCLHHFNGMFAFVIWDDKEKRVFAARDRFGVKPLYYYRDGNKIAFASEIKQILNMSTYKVVINKNHLDFFIKNKFHPISNSTLFANITSFEPGQVLISVEGNYNIKTWYNARNHLRCIKKSKEEFLELLKDSIIKRLIADVPIGALLSGGLDSSSIVCLISELVKNNPSYKDFQTFTSWSPDPSIDEKVYSDAVIQKTGLINYVSEIKNQSLQSDIQKIIYHQEEPFISTSVQSEWNIYKTIGKTTNLKVVLDGQGSDELMCGYSFMLPYLLSHYIKNGSIIKGLIEFYYIIKKHKNLAPHTLVIDTIAQVAPSVIKLIQAMRGKAFVAGDHLNFNNFQDYTFYLLRRSIEPQLRWQDRSSMAFSIESRQPFLDFRLVEFLLSLSMDEKFHHGTTKMPLRESMRGVLPEVVRTRKTKFGFPSPQNTLMKMLNKDIFNKYLNLGASLMESYGILEYKDILEQYKLSTEMSNDLCLPFTLGIWADQFKV